MALSRLARSRWNFASPLALAALLSLPAWGLAADEQAQPASEQEQPASELRDVTDLVEVTINGGLTSSNRMNHSAAVVIKNTSEEDLSGPLVVVVDGTGIATLSVKEPAGMLEEDKPYVEFLEKRGSLKAGKSLRPQKIEFTTDEALTLGQRQQFALKLRVLYLPESARTAKTEKNSKGEDLIEGKKYSEQDVARIATIQDKWTLPLLQRGQGNAYGTAIAEDENGDLYVKVYTQREGIADDLPDQIDGISVKTMVIGAPFRSGPSWRAGERFPIYQNGIIKERGAGKFGPGAPVPDPMGPPARSAEGDQSLSGPPGDPTIRFPRPVPIGVSISNVDRLLLTNFCYSGTLGCRCIDSMGNTFALTNAHVGGEVFVLNPSPPELLINIPGERIVQTSTADMLPIPCIPDLNNLIGVVADFEIIGLWQQQQILDGTAVPNLMDASVIRTTTNLVQAETPDDGYGVPKRVLATPRLGMPVQKYGRTTIYTAGQVTGINVSAMISYDPPLLGYFIKQIECANLAGPSSIAQASPVGAPGDSGSLVVVHSPGHETDRQPVALLFAGGPSGEVDAALCNPLGPVLSRFNLSIDDGSGTPHGAGPSGTMGGVIGPHDPPSDF